MDSLLTLPKDIHLPGTPEHFSPLLTSDSGLLVERIVSWGHVTPEGQWYDQEKDEWALLLEGSARLGFADGREVAASVFCCPSMYATVYWRPASPVSGWPSTHRSCIRKMMARQPPRRDRKSVVPIPSALRPARTGNTSPAGACPSQFALTAFVQNTRSACSFARQPRAL